MSEINIYSINKSNAGTVEFPESWNRPVNYSLIHQVVVAQQQNRRQGNARVKNRHEVSGSTRKIYRQKGTGGARHGDIKAPLFIGGGQAFGPKPKEYEVKLPQKIRRSALREALLLKKTEGKLLILDSLNFEKPKTKEAAKVFSKLEITNALVVLGDAVPFAEKSIRNLRGFEVCRFDSLSVLHILRYKHLVLTKSAYEKFIVSCKGGA